tara:strand:+ start:343 stop:576 length:234 start_codon:yes stop_codon:yes gene_type:complete
MKNENIPADVKSKSLKDTRKEINDILNKLESKNADLSGSIDDYKRLIQLNNHVDFLFKKKVKEITTSKKILKKNDKK